MSANTSESKGTPYAPGCDAYSDQQLLLGDDGAKTIADVGANVGNTVEKYFFAHPAATIHAFEPDPSTFSQLTQRYSTHPRVQCWCSAVSNHQHMASFFVNEDPGTSSLLPRPETGRRYYNQRGVLRQKIEVPAVTLDGFCEKNGISMLDILKLDIQGGELLALEGADRLLNSHSVRLIYTEVQFIRLYERAPLFHDICKFLEARGFSLFGLYDQVVAANGQLRFADAIFIPPTIRERVLDQFPEEPY